MKKNLLLLITVIAIGIFTFGSYLNVHAETYINTYNQVSAISENVASTTNMSQYLDGKLIDFEAALTAEGVDVTASSNADYNTFFSMEEGNYKYAAITEISSNYVMIEGTLTKTFTISYNLVTVTKGSGSTHTVTFDAAGGSTVPSQTVADGETAVEPENPTKDGYEFMYWLGNGNTYIFDPITADTTFVAQWIRRFNITSGKEQTFYLESDKDIVIVSDGPLDEFDDFAIYGENNPAIFMDDLESGKDYALENGSTKLTLKNSFLKTLAEDLYYVEFYYYNNATYGDGYTDTTLQVKAGADPNPTSTVVNNGTTGTTATATKLENPPTADNMKVYFTMFVLSAIVLGIVLKKEKHLINYE